MNNNDVVQRVAKMLCNKLEVETLTESDDLREYGLGMDSISTMEVIVALENEFGIEIDESEFDPQVLRTVKSISLYISTI